jgi:hypothetical protein
MEEFLKKITAIGKAFSLSERERTAIRLHLAAYIDEHPAKAPLFVRVSGHTDSIISGIRMHLGYRSIAAALVLVLVAGVGTSYAAADSLPGNPLYALKVNLDEPVERATVASSQSETQWELTLANRRLQEAEKLAATGTLTPANATIVVDQLNNATQQFNASVATLATSTAGAVAVADAQSDLDAALSAHVQVLSDIASSSEAVSNQVAPVLAVVRAHASSAQAARITALDGLTDDATSSIKIAANTELAAALSQLTVIRALASSTMSATPTDASSSVQIASAASSTEAAINDGTKKLAHGRFREAFEAFQSAVQAATQGQIGAQAQASLGTTTDVPPTTATSDASSTAATDDSATTSAATSSAPATATSSAASSAADDSDGPLQGLKALLGN